MSYRLHASPGYLLSLAARLQERRLEEGLRALGLTRTTWCILLAVGNERLDRPSEIARFVGIDRTATSRALRQMEAAGLVARRSGSADRRTTAVALTPEGARRLAAATPAAEDNVAAITAKLGAEDTARLHAILTRLVEGEATELRNF